MLFECNVNNVMFDFSRLSYLEYILCINKLLIVSLSVKSSEIGIVRKIFKIKSAFMFRTQVVC